MLNFRLLVAVQILLALLLGFPLYGWLDFSGRSLQPKFPQATPEEAQALARLLAGTYGSLGLAALGFLLPGPWPYRRKAALALCFANLTAAVLVAGVSPSFSDALFSYGLPASYGLLALGFGLNVLDPDRGDSEWPGLGWFSIRNVLTAGVAGLAMAGVLLTSTQIGSFTRLPGRIGFALGFTTAFLVWVLLLFVGSSYLAKALLPESPDSEEQVRKRLLKQLGQTAAQEERNRLARDLHDSIKQQLFTIHLGVAAARERWDRDPPGARQRLDDIARSAKEALAEMRALLQQLSPHAVASAGLIEALREQCEALGYRAGTEVDFQIGEVLPEDRLPAQAQESLFRIAQEALANVARHARAEHVRVALGRRGDAVVLEIEDDGQGFDLAREPRGLGLRNMEERTAEIGGQFGLRSEPGKGTTLTATIPLLAATTARENKKALYDANLAHDLILLLLAALLGLAAFNPASWITSWPLAFAVPYFGVLGATLAVALQVSYRIRRRLAKPEPVKPALAAFDHRARTWFAAAAAIQSFWLGWPGEAWAPGRVLWLSTAGLLTLWAGEELFNFHRLTRFRGWRTICKTPRVFHLGAAALVVGFTLRHIPAPEPATFTLVGIAALLMLHTELRQIPTPPS